MNIVNNFQLNYGILRVCLDTTYFCWNWKHCSKIIFKYVNSIVGPVNSAFCLLHSESMWCYYSRAKKKKTKRQKTQTWKRCWALWSLISIDPVWWPNPTRIILRGFVIRVLWWVWLPCFFFFFERVKIL